MFDALIGAAGKVMDYFSAKDRQKSQEQMAANNIALQREFAQSGIQWKVADAKAAGIHPLFALGAQTHSFSPVSVGDVPGTNFSGIGQDIGRAINATRTQTQRNEAVVRTVQDLEIAGKELDNQIKATTVASQVQRLRQNANPPFPEGAFVVPEAKKAEERTPLMLEGSRVKTSPGTSPGKAWEDQLGDDIFSPGFIPNLIGMLGENTKGMSFLDILRAVDRKTRIW